MSASLAVVVTKCINPAIKRRVDLILNCFFISNSVGGQKVSSKMKSPDVLLFCVRRFRIKVQNKY